MVRIVHIFEVVHISDLLLDFLAEKLELLRLEVVEVLPLELLGNAK